MLESDHHWKIVKLVRMLLEMPWKGMCGCTNQCSRWKIHCAVTNVCRNMPHNHRLVRLGGVSLCDCEYQLLRAPPPQIGSGGKRFTARWRVSVLACPTTIDWFDWEKRFTARWREIVGVYLTTTVWFDLEEILDLGIPRSHGLVRLGRDLGSWNIPHNHGLVRPGRDL